MASAIPSLEPTVEINRLPSLPAKLRKIRVFTLFPGSWSSPLKCQFSICDLDDRPQFETISYTWGDSGDSVSITIDGVELTIPHNLQTALKYIRSQDDALTLWADAVCIDQSNDEEKAEQVAMMGDIFQACSSMYLWLGEPGKSLERNPWGLVEHFAANKHYNQLPGYQLVEGRWTFQDNPHFQDMWASFTDMLSKAWWTRLWCVQESVLSPKATIMLGRWRVSWSKILMSRENQVSHELKCCASLGGLMPPNYSYQPDNLIVHALEKSSDSGLSADPKGMNLDRVLRTFRYKACKDPRDRVYGLLGLVNKSMAAKIRPDYSLPVNDIYLQAMKLSMAESDGDLQYLTGSGFNSERHDLPTWTRDLSAPLTRVEASCETARYHLYHLYNAACNAGHDVGKTSQLPNKTTLALTGVPVDGIGSIGMTLNHINRTSMVEALENWNKVARLNDTGLGSSDHELYERFWRTMNADVIVREGGATKRIDNPMEQLQKEQVQAITQHLNNQTEPLVKIDWRTVLYAANGRAFFRTQSGRLGLCPPGARVGDQIWVFAGGRVPFVLRAENESAQSANGSGPGMPIFKFMGECYQ
ncbi:hypothetical protein TW65_08999 [Stemphylium lycopersici]|nr:hypothetical protein TW65_08999 [Stemphylium lycopersici]